MEWEEEGGASGKDEGRWREGRTLTDQNVTDRRYVKSDKN